MRLALGSIAVAVVVSFAPAARAQTPAQMADAQRHFDQALRLIEQSRWLDAIPELEATRRIVVTPPVLYNLGLAQRAVGQRRLAIRSFREFLERSGARISAERRAEVDGYLRDLAAALVRVTLDVAPATATVSVDGSALPARTTSVELDPGRHTIGATAPGFRPSLQAVDVASGATSAIALRLEAIPLTGRLHVESNVASATIWVDDRAAGTGTVEVEVAPGRHTVRAQAPGRRTFRDAVAVSIGTTTRLRADLGAADGVIASPWLWIVVGAVVVGAGIAATAVALSPGEPYTPPLGTVTTAVRAEP